MIWIYGKDDCIWCDKAVQYLTDTNRMYRYININEPGVLDYLRLKGLKTVPQIWLDGNHIGGYNDLIFYFDQDKIPVEEL